MHNNLLNSVYLRLFLIVFLSANIHATLAGNGRVAEPITPIPFEHNQDKAKVELGRMLFNDVRLSKNNNIACNFCHKLSQGGDDGLKRSITNNGEPDLINAPTVFNSRYNFRQTWRGKFRELEEQAEGDLRNPRHSNIDWFELLPKLNAIPEYVSAFRKTYKKEVDRQSVLDAIATFERSLITPNSRFDKYLRGNSKAITEDEKEGYRIFKTRGCIACHQGVNLGGNVFQKFGLFDNYLEKRGGITKADFGLFNVTGNEKDKFVFRVPSLRNIEVTGPYLHDGEIESLAEVVRIMGDVQLGTSLNDNQVELLVAFLKTLTGSYKGIKLVDE